jgi:hypothetical protein
MRAGELRARNPELAANFVYFLCTIWPLRYWSIGKFGEAAVTGEIVDFILCGIGAGDDATPRHPTPAITSTEIAR